MIIINSAKANTIIGTTTVSSTIILNLIHDIMPYISDIGISAGAILACHGVYELIKMYWKKYTKDD